MHAKYSDWQNGWFGLSLELTVEEIDHLIGMLQCIRNDPEQHFHITSDYKGGGGLGDIEICQMTQLLHHNMSISGRAMGPGETLKPNT
jgi:hypothetical protein